MRFLRRFLQPVQADFSFWVLISVALMMFIAPWVYNAELSLTFGAYDLAEWASLHPLSNQTTPVMLVSLLLRLQLVLVTWLVALFAPKLRFSWQWWGWFIGVGILLIAQLPPLEYLVNGTGNDNQLQQLILLIVSGVGFLFGIMGWLQRVRTGLIVLISIIGIVSAGWGLFTAVEYMQDYRLDTAVSVGGIGMILVYMGMLGWVMWQGNHNDRPAPTI